MEREERDLDGERERERGEEVELLPGGERHGEEAVVAEGEASALGLHPPGTVEDGDQHEEAPEQREEHELDGGIDASGPAPHPDQEVHRDEHQLPEDVEEEEIRRQERAQHPGLEDEQESEELLHPPRDVAPRGEDDDRHQEGGEEDEEEAHAVDP